jgi:hypothetical protein
MEPRPFMAGNFIKGSNFWGVAHKLFDLNVKQQYFLPVYIHNSAYDLKFILPALARLQKVKS